jgi:hypothetical protein
VKRIRKAIKSPKRAIASVKAKPKSPTRVSSCCKEGFREIPITREPKTEPIPTPAPVDNP